MAVVGRVLGGGVAGLLAGLVTGVALDLRFGLLGEVAHRVGGCMPIVLYAPVFMLMGGATGAITGALLGGMRFGQPPRAGTGFWLVVMAPVAGLWLLVVPTSLAMACGTQGWGP